MAALGVLCLVCFCAIALTAELSGVTGSSHELPLHLMAFGLFLVIVGGGLILLASTYFRGRIILDERGLFYERGGRLSFIALNEISRVRWEREALLAENLYVEGYNRGLTKRLILSRVLCFGHPLRDIEASLNRILAHRPTASPPVGAGPEGQLSSTIVYRLGYLAARHPALFWTTTVCAILLLMWLITGR